MRALENKVLMIIYGLRSNEITGGWIRLHNEELHSRTCRQILSEC
jgi:hypothetical protein